MSALLRPAFKRLSHTARSALYSQKRFIAAIGRPAPPFSCTAVVNRKFDTIDLEDYKGKYLVLFFYPLDFTFVCPTEIIEFNDRVNEFQAVHCEVVGASVDSQFSHLAWIDVPREEGGLGETAIPLLADLNKKIATDYGCLHDDGVTFRATYIIDTHGVVRHISLNDRGVGRSIDEVLRTVKAMRFADTYGEVCPANWKPGDRSIVPDPVGKLEYFEQASKGSITL